MSTNDYQFITHWRVPGTLNEVADILRKAEDLPRWWPAVYLDVKVLEPGDADGVGKVVDLYTKGWLPLHLALAISRHRIELSIWLFARSVGRFYRAR